VSYVFYMKNEINKFSAETYVKWYKELVLLRRFEEKAGQLYGQEKIKGFCHLYIGQEACVVGTVSALKTGDKYVTAYRDHAHPLCLGTEPKCVMAELFGKETGISKGRGGSMHIFDKKNNFMGGHAIVGGHIPLGAGIAFAEKYKATGNLCIVFMGDGAVWQGMFHESLNLAMLYKLPIIFVIENNGYAMGTSVERSSCISELYKLGNAYGMHSEVVNGMVVEDVYNAVSAAADITRNEFAPTLLEFKTYRYKGHSMSDPAKYRTKEELENYKSVDPIEAVRNTILSNGFLDANGLTEIDQHIKKVIAEAVEFAENSAFPDPSQVYDYIYAEDNYLFAKN
jgi:pyruvate dehydrogenase E1 component alpha subunit